MHKPAFSLSYEVFIPLQDRGGEKETQVLIEFGFQVVILSQPVGHRTGSPWHFPKERDFCSNGSQK